MSRDIAASTHSFAFECMESGRAQLDAQNPTTPSSSDILSTIASTLQKPTKDIKLTEDISSPSPKDTSNDSRDNTLDNKDLNKIPWKIAGIILDGSDNTGRKQPARDQEPAVKSSEQNNVLEDNTKYASSTTGSVPTGDSPLVLVCTHSGSPSLIDERPQPMPLMVDEPDPRLIDALRKPLDRPLILKVEQEVITFINGTLDFYDTSPLNSYHRMLVHKIAEFYRLTHVVSPDAIDCVRLFRGHAARIPPMKLSDIASPKSPPDTPPSGPQLAVKIMRRKSPSQKGINDEADQAGDGKGGGGLQVHDPSKPMTREEREAAYQLARARIFGDFKESPPESPSPSKSSNEKQTSQRNNNKELDDGFQSRSQYSYRVITQTSPGFVNSGSRFTPAPSAAPGFSGLAHSSHILNPTAVSFNPNAGTFLTSQQAGPALNQQYPVTLSNRGGYTIYPSSQVPNMPFPVMQPNYSRPVIFPNGNAFNSPMTQLPSGPQGSHVNAASGNSRLPPTNTSIASTPTDGSRGYPRIGQLFDQQTGSSVTYPSSFQYVGHQISNPNGGTNGIMNGGMNGGWPPVGTHPIQPQGRFQQGEGQLGNPYTGNFGPYGLGRG